MTLYSCHNYKFGKECTPKSSISKTKPSQWPTSCNQGEIYHHSGWSLWKTHGGRIISAKCKKLSYPADIELSPINL